MKKPFKLLLAPMLLASLAACESSSNLPGPDSDDLRSTVESRNSFIPNTLEQKSSSIQSELKEILNCKEASTNKRLEKEKFSVTWTVLSRSQNKYNGPTVVQSTDNTYSTEDEGNTYTESSRIGRWTIEGDSILTKGPIGYKDICSKSDGCDKEKRKWTEGTGVYKIQLLSHANRAYEQKSIEMGGTNCSLSNSEVDSATVVQGTYRIMGEDRKAMLHKVVAKGDIYCSSSNYYNDDKKVYIGKGVQISKMIVLADSFPQPLRSRNTEDEFFNPPVDHMGLSGACSRTIVFSGEEVTMNGERISGSSSELLEVKIDGKVEALEEWKKSREDGLQTIARLEDEKERARINLRQSEAAHDKAKTDADTLGREARRLDNEAVEAETDRDRVLADPNATEDQKVDARTKAIDKRRLAAKAQTDKEAADQHVISTEAAKNRADSALSDAERALDSFKAKHSDL